MYKPLVIHPKSAMSVNPVLHAEKGKFCNKFNKNLQPTAESGF